MTDGSGHTVWSLKYLPFGEVYDDIATITGFGDNIRLPGQVHDGETDLHYNWHRYYKPQLGRYIQADPIGQGGGTNLFSYAKSNPITRWDRFGLMTWSCEETLEIIEEVGRQWLGEALLHHWPGGRYDYGTNQPTDTFMVGDRSLRADEFGNYLAGYAGFKTGWFLGYGGVIIGGVLTDFFAPFQDAYKTEQGEPYRDLEFDLDRDSWPMIDAGRRRAVMESQGQSVGRCSCK